MAEATTTAAPPQTPPPVQQTKAQQKAEEKARREAAKIQQNGVTRPKDGTQTGRVWAISDEESRAAGRAATRKEVIAKGTAEGLNEATIATQYGRWRKFHGLKAEPRPMPTPQVTTQPAPGTPAATGAPTPAATT